MVLRLLTPCRVPCLPGASIESAYNHLGESDVADSDRDADPVSVRPRVLGSSLKALAGNSPRIGDYS